MNWLIFFISALATYWLSLMLSSEEGPLAIFGDASKSSADNQSLPRHSLFYLLKHSDRASGHALSTLLLSRRLRNKEAQVLACTFCGKVVFQRSETVSDIVTADEYEHLAPEEKSPLRCV